MIFPKKHVLFGILFLAIPITVHFFPRSFEVIAIYRLSKHLHHEGKPENTIEKYAQHHLSLLPSEACSFRCEPTEQRNAARCVSTCASHSDAEAIHHYLVSELPLEFGWIPPTDLEIRIQEAHQMITTWEFKRETLRLELESIQESSAENDKTVKELQRLLKTNKADLVVKKKQLGLMEEALKEDRPDAQLTVFRQKRDELFAIIAALEKDNEVAEQDLKKAIIPIQERESKGVALKTLEANIEATQDHIEIWNRALAKGLMMPRVIDPDSFLIRTDPSESTIKGIRSYYNLFWSFPAALALFGIAILISQHFQKPEEVFKTPEEVERETGLRLIARIK